jgi:SAM-dependent methyltransferase
LAATETSRGSVSPLRRAPLLRHLAGCDADLSRILRRDWTVLDVGCGSGSRSAPHALARAIGVDIHFASVAQVRSQRSRLAALCASLHRLPIATGAIDAVVALDVIEHFTKQEATSLLDEFERVVRRAIVLLTPNGFLPQSGTPANPFMEHRSGWSASELTTLGYSVHGINGWHTFRGPYAVPRLGALGKALSLASQPIARRHPDKAFHLLAVKYL